MALHDPPAEHLSLPPDYADNRELREQIFTAYIMRGDHGDEYDNKAILSEILTLRAEKAKLLGYRHHADFVLERRMAKTPEAVYELLEDLWYPSLGVAREEAATLQAAIEEDGFDFKLEPWDWRYYAEKVRRARYDVDEQEIRPYFMIDNVIDGAFYVANRLYGIEFTERFEGIPDLSPRGADLRGHRRRWQPPRRLHDRLLSATRESAAAPGAAGSAASGSRTASRCGPSCSTSATSRVRSATRRR